MSFCGVNVTANKLANLPRREKDLQLSRFDLVHGLGPGLATAAESGCGSGWLQCQSETSNAHPSHAVPNRDTGEPGHGQRPPG